jgi:hypothetical protein
LGGLEIGKPQLRLTQFRHRQGNASHAHAVHPYRRWRGRATRKPLLVRRRSPTVNYRIRDVYIRASLKVNRSGRPVALHKEFASYSFVKRSPTPRCTKTS